MNEQCPYCGSRNVLTIPRPDTRHHGELRCGDENRHIKWVAKPRRDPGELAPPPGLEPFENPPPLVGTEKQIPWAEQVRPVLVARVQRHLDSVGGDSTGLIPAMWTIREAGWWISNRDRHVDDIRWPDHWYRAKG